MTQPTRRQLVQSLPLLALVPALAARAESSVPETSASAQAAAQAKTAAGAPNCTEPLLTHCKAFPYETLPIRYSDAGAPTRQILEGRVPGSEIIEVHETTLAPGKMPHPAHKHPHGELLLVRKGTIEFHSDSPTVLVTEGGAAYCAPGELHGFKNVGTTEAQYFIVKVGAQPVCQK